MIDRLETFVSAHPASRFRGEAMFTLAAAAYNAGECEKAEQLFAALAHDAAGGNTRAEALFWAGKAAEAGGAGLKANATLNELLSSADAGGELTAEALLLQGDVLARLGRYDAAIVAFDEVLARFPQTRQAAEARGRKGDCQYTLGESDPARYEEALLSYRTLAGEAQAADDLKIEAMYKVAKALERQGRAEAALDHYLEAVYAFLRMEDATAEAAAWFTRAAYSAAAELGSRREFRRGFLYGNYRVGLFFLLKGDFTIRSFVLFFIFALLELLFQRVNGQVCCLFERFGGLAGAGVVAADVHANVNSLVLRRFGVL